MYVDDKLFYAKEADDIDQVIEGLKKNAEMELEVEDDVAGFLGVHIDKKADGTIELTQKGLIQRILRSLDVKKKTTKRTPAVFGALGLDPEGEPAQGTFSYASVIGMLLYLTGHSRPDLQFAVS